MVRIIFVKNGGEAVTLDLAEGDNLMEAARDNGLDVEGTCGGAMACSTCHMILTEADFVRFDEPDEAEDAILDIAPGAVATSRLGCQLQVRARHDGMTIRLPDHSGSAL